MSDFAIPRDDVHRLAEACADDQERYQSIATRLVKEQRRLSRFVKKEIPTIEGQEGQVALYLYTVVIRIFEAYGGALGRVGSREIDAARAKIGAAAAGLLPFDDGFPERVRGVADRAQPHILDESLWALFERDDLEEGELNVDPDKAGLIFLVLWVATEALDAVWEAPEA
jgi:hypothetical protein